MPQVQEAQSTMKTNWVRRKWKAGEASIGCFMGLGSPQVAGLLAHAGFEWLVIETEHNGIDVPQVEHMLMSINATQAVPLVRVPPNDPVFIQRALDIGAMGIVAPLIRTADEAREIIRATRYPPEGTRGFGPLGASYYTFKTEEYFRNASDNITVIFIIETKEAAENIEEIAAVPGVDGLMMGQCDLCLSLGLDPLKFNEYSEIEDVVQATLRAGNKHGVAVGMNMFTPEQLLKRRQEGFRILAYGPEYVLFSQAVRAGLEAYRS